MDFSNYKYDATMEKITKILMDKTQSNNPLYFRILISFYFAVAASHMRAKVSALDRGIIPINMYAFNLAPSGFGKSLSTGFMEETILGGFRHRFLNATFVQQTQRCLAKLAVDRASIDGSDEDLAVDKVNKEFNSCGAMAFSFDSGTAPAIKQLRHKLLMCQAGSLNLIIDEVGSNLAANTEMFTTFIELFDMGRLKQKLIKNTSDNPRVQEITDSIPSNLLLFGVPSKLLDSSKTEEQFREMLETGYARRCFFGYVPVDSKSKIKLSPQEVFKLKTDTTVTNEIDAISKHMFSLADALNMNRIIPVPKDVSIKLIEYKQFCEERADNFPKHLSLHKAEMSHRDFKVLKLAGAYAFIEDCTEVTQEHLESAIKLVEDSGLAFNKIVDKDKPWVMLAKHIAERGQELTHAELAQELPYYPSTAAAKTEMLNLAVAYGYKNNIVIKRRFEDSIEFLSGESLKKTDIEKITLAYSNDITEGYFNDYVPFNRLHELCTKDNMHWINHHVINGYRADDCVKAGFNLLVLDVDDGTTLEAVKTLFKEYKYFIHTTKRHTPTEHRFRIVLPINFELKLDRDDFKEFMKNIYEYLPFKTDTQTGQRSRKWSTFNGTYFYNEGELFDALPFIPKTSKNEIRKQSFKDQSALDNLERWFIHNSGDGNRNNMLLRYAMVLADSGYSFENVRLKVLDLNNKLSDKLSEAEILSTILVTVTKHLANKAD